MTPTNNSDQTGHSPADDPRLDDLMRYLDASPSPFHAVFSAAERLARAGFSQLDELTAWTSDEVRGRKFVIRGGALIAWVNETGCSPTAGIRIVGAHTDSPNLRVKPRPDVTSAGWRQIGVEVYGGILNNSWLDRDLGLSGRVVLADGSSKLVLVDRPIARVAQLAVHLDREVNDRSLVLDKQLHLTPLIGLGTSDEGAFRSFVAETISVDAASIVSWDLMLHDLTPAALLGVQQELLVSGRIDNLFSAWAAVVGLVASADRSLDPEPEPNSTSAVQVAALFDHEEVGSASTTGAAGPLLETVLERIMAADGLGVDERARALQASSCVSADMAHSVHPNYVDRHEPQHRPVPNVGPVIKVNVSQRYATDASTSALFASACERAGVPVQTFVSKNSQPCGSTIGPITATRLGIATVDVGCAMLSMHSARELCGARDADLFVRVLIEYFAG
jgi:aspartyl aminopeptidase